MQAHRVSSRHCQSSGADTVRQRAAAFAVANAVQNGQRIRRNVLVPRLAFSIGGFYGREQRAIFVLFLRRAMHKQRSRKSAIRAEACLWDVLGFLRGQGADSGRTRQMPNAGWKIGVGAGRK